MSGMNGFYGSPYHDMGLSQMGGDTTMGDVTMAELGDEMMGDGLDEIISQNNAEMQRRRTMSTAFDSTGPYNQHNRRASMMEFGSGTDGNSLADFGFDPAPTHPTYHPTINNMNLIQKASSLRKSRSKEDLSLNAVFPPYGPIVDAVPNSSAYSSPVHPSAPMSMPPANYMSTPVDMTVNQTNLASSVPPMDFSSIGQQIPYTQSPIQSAFSTSFTPHTQPLGVTDTASDEETIMEKVAQMSMPGAVPNLPGPTDTVVPNLCSSSGGATPSMPSAMQTMTTNTPQHISLDQMQVSSTPYSSAGMENDGMASLSAEPAPLVTQYPNAYSSSGFDMLAVLMRVAGRKNPEINIGPVDMSCAFVVCDVTQHDLPIVYCSENFERLTGYSKHEILGRNCRFLQAPDGRVQAGVKRKYVDDKSVLHIKNKIAKRQEVQLSLINYRKGGQPFMNLLTMIPVQWDNNEYRYYVGFQVDLVEQPGSVAGRNPDGSYAINYQRGSLPRYLPQPPTDNRDQHDLGQTVGRDDVSAVLNTIAQGESELSKRIWDKVLLENTDDVVHVLSLKGLFLYLSPACRKVLEYDASELVGTALSSVCHPSDIVPVTRELKDTSSGSSINVVFRIRRKRSGYTWFESHGALHTEQGKGRKCIILVGRERPVYALTRPGLEIGDSEVWSKLSTAGMVLFVASNVRLLLDRTPEDLVGTSMQALMRPESRLEFGRALEEARMGRRTSFMHDLQNKRGQVLHAQTLLFPGDAEEGSKPTFLIAQTRLVKMSRSTLAQRPSVPPSPRMDHASAGSVTPQSTTGGQSLGGSSAIAASTPSAHGGSADKEVITHAGAQALSLGNQDEILASEVNIFDELKTTRSTSWQFELRQMEKQNRILAEELQGLLGRKKKRKRRKGAGQMEKDCANCHTRVTPEWRRGPSGNRDLCNSCGLRWAKQNGRVSPRKSHSVSDGGKTPNQSASSPEHTKENHGPPTQKPGPGDPQSTPNTPHPNGNNHLQLKGPNRTPQDSNRDSQATASAAAPNLDSHIAKTAKLDSQNMAGSIADRHHLPVKIDEDVEPPEPGLVDGDG